MTRRGSWAVLLCGGNGTRMGEAENKTLIKIGGIPAIVRACRTFEGVTEGTVLVTRAGEEALFEKVLKEYHL